MRVSQLFVTDGKGVVQQNYACYDTAGKADRQTEIMQTRRGYDARY